MSKVVGCTRLTWIHFWLGEGLGDLFSACWYCPCRPSVLYGGSQESLLRRSGPFLVSDCTSYGLEASQVGPPIGDNRRKSDLRGEI